jgi:putative transposase
MTPSSPQEPTGIAEHPLSPPHRGWYSRGYLPHCDYPGLLQSITYRLADSLPASALERIEAEVRSLPPQQRTRERRRRIEAWLDAGYGCCVLGRPEAAACVVENWRHFAGARYDLIAWVVMPNHVHLLIRVYEGTSLGKVVQSWKSYTGRRIGAMMEDGRAGARRSQAGGSRAGWSSDEVVGGVWMREYWDRYIRDERHFEAVVGYIHDNPVKAGLVKKAEDWPWSSAREWAEGAELALGDPGGPGGTGDPGEEGAGGAELALGDPSVDGCS